MALLHKHEGKRMGAEIVVTRTLWWSAWVRCRLRGLASWEFLELGSSFVKPRIPCLIYTC
jgi:hypothetical protein